MSATHDPLKELQLAAARAAEHTSPGERAFRVVVFGANGAKLLDAAVPACCCGKAAATGSTVSAGWVVTDRAATFNEVAVPVKGRSLDVLRVLAGGDVVSVDELRAAWGDYNAEDGTIRWQVGELRKVLKKQFGDFPGELIESTGAGYRLVLK